MAIIKNLYDNKYISLYEEDNTIAYVKMALYNSWDNKEYTVITDIVITKDSKVIYKANTFQFYNTKDYISVDKYIDKIVFIINNNIYKDHSLKIILNRFFLDSKTIQVKLIYNHLIKELKSKKETEEYNNYLNEAKQLINELINLANKNNITICFTPSNYHIRLLNIKGKNNNKYFNDMVMKYDSNNKLLKPHLIYEIDNTEVLNINDWDLELKTLNETKKYITNNF